MLNPELKVIQGIFKYDNFILRLIESNIDESYFRDNLMQRAFLYIKRFFLKYNSLPSKTVFEHRTGITLHDITDPEDYIFDEFIEKDLHTVLHEGISNVKNLLKQKQRAEALEEIFKYAHKASERSSKNDDVMASDKFQAVFSDYEYLESLKGKIDGYRTPWEPLDEITGGWHPEDFVVIAARPGIGKTFLMVIMANHIFEVHKDINILVLSGEMPKKVLARRFAAINAKIPQRQARKGTLSPSDKDKFKESVERLKKSNIKFVGKGFGNSMNKVVSLVSRYKPDIVFLDGLYLLTPHITTAKMSRFDRVAQVAGEIKSMASKYEIPVICSTQFNRDVKKSHKEAGTESIGYSDSISQNCDILIGMFQTKEMKERNQMKLDVLKNREGDQMQLNIIWDIEFADFSLQGSGQLTNVSNGKQTSTSSSASGGDGLVGF